MTRLGALIIVFVSAAALVAAGPVGGAAAQLQLPPLLPPPPTDPNATTTTTTTTAAPPTSSTTNVLDALLAPLTTTTEAPPPDPAAAPAPAAVPAPASVPGNLGGEGEVPGDGAGPFPSSLAALMNSVRRSRPNSSDGLMDALRALTDLGVPVDEAMRVGMGHFPVAGRAHYSHDWWYPRFGPDWRLHEGTDLFAARGTPVRSPTTGTVKFGDGGLGGIAVYVTQSDGTYFYMAHLDSRAPGLKPGQTVGNGDVVGFVGTTGNAAGGSPHLHFEVHPATRIVTVGKGKKRTTKAVYAPVRPGTELPPSDPKALLDFWLADAVNQLPGIVATYAAQQVLAAPPTPANAVPTDKVTVHSLSVGGLISADAPLARTPLLGLALLLMIMVVVLMPVLAPRRSLAGGGAAVAVANRHLAMNPPQAGRRRRRRKPVPEVAHALLQPVQPSRKGRKGSHRVGAGHAPTPPRAEAGPPPATPPLPFKAALAHGTNGAATNGAATNGASPVVVDLAALATADPEDDQPAPPGAPRARAGGRPAANRVRKHPPPARVG